MSLTGNLHPTIKKVDVPEEQTVILNSGTRAPILTVKYVAMKILYLKRKEGVLQDLVNLCRNPNYQVSAKSQEELLSLRIIERSGTGFIVPKTTSDIVLSMALGDGPTLRFVTPIA
jgi:hypothetical protein